jgi:copper chaperone
MAASPSIEWTLPTMTCGHCVKVVTKTVQTLDPQAQLAVDLPNHRVSIQSSRPESEFRQALTAEGYAPAEA